MQIAVYRGRQLRSTHPVGRRPLIVGRSKECDIVVKHAVVSRRHLELAPADGGLDAIDLDTANGTFVRGERITRKRVVPGDRIELGNWVLVVERADDLGMPPLAPMDSMPPPDGETAMQSPSEILRLLDRARETREAHLAWLGPAGTQTHVLGLGVVRIGFDDAADIRLQGRSLLGATAAEIRREGRAWTITATSALVAVRVNGDKVRQQVLVDGDSIEIKGQTVRFRGRIA